MGGCGWACTRGGSYANEGASPAKPETQTLSVFPHLSGVQDTRVPRSRAEDEGAIRRVFRGIYPPEALVRRKLPAVPCTWARGVWTLAPDWVVVQAQQLQKQAGPWVRSGSLPFLIPSAAIGWALLPRTSGGGNASSHFSLRKPLLWDGPEGEGPAWLRGWHSADSGCELESSARRSAALATREQGRPTKQVRGRNGTQSVSWGLST